MCWLSYSHLKKVCKFLQKREKEKENVSCSHRQYLTFGWYRSLLWIISAIHSAHAPRISFRRGNFHPSALYDESTLACLSRPCASCSEVWFSTTAPLRVNTGTHKNNLTKNNRSSSSLSIVSSLISVHVSALLSRVEKEMDRSITGPPRRAPKSSSQIEVGYTRRSFSCPLMPQK